MSNHLVGLKLVLTGDFDAYERDAATRALEDLGADVTSAVSGKTTAVIAGKNAGATKIGQAAKRGLPVLDEAQLLALIAGKRLDEVLTSQGPAPVVASAAKVAAASTAAVPRVAFPYQAPPPRDGEYREYHPGTKQISVSGFYQDGLRHGSWKKYFPGGQLQEDYFWERGQQEGPELDWIADGTKICDGKNRRGKPVGTWTWWHPGGVQSFSYTYDDLSRRQGAYAFHTPDGELRVTGQWLDDQHHGPWTFKNEASWEKLERSYHRNLQHGNEAAWYPGGQLAIRRGWFLGKKHGREELFDASGNPTYQGTWCYGHPIGEHSSWDGAHNQTRTNYVAGIPEALHSDTKTRDKAIKKLAKAKDSYAKAGVFTEAAGYQYRAAYLLHLWRSGDLAVTNDPELWELLAEASGLLSGEDMVAFLRQAKPKADSYGYLLPYLPAELDRMVMEVYQRDPAPIDAAWKTLPEPMQSVVAFVRARYGHDIGNALFKELPTLVKKHVEQYGLGDVLLPDEAGLLTLQKLYADHYGTKTPLFHKILSLFGTFEDWRAALKAPALKEAAEAVARVSFRTFHDVIEFATDDEMIVLLSGIALEHETQDTIYQALTRWRSDDAATLGRLALAIQDHGLRKWPTVAIAIQKYLAEGKEPPPELVAALRLDAVSPTYTSHWYTDPIKDLDAQQRAAPAYRVAYRPSHHGAAAPRTKLLQDVMQALPPAAARRVIENTLAQEYGKIVAAQYLHVVDDPALWERFLDIAEAEKYGYHDPTVYGLGELGLRAIPLLTARLDRTKDKNWIEGYRKAIVVAMARATVDKADIPATLDGFFKLDSISDDAVWLTYAPFVERILWGLPPARVEAILLRELSSSAVAFARAFALISCCPTAAVCEKAFTELLQRENKLKNEQQRDVGAGVSSLPNAVDWVRWIRQSGGGGGLGDALKQAIGHQNYEALDQELAAAGTPQVKAVDALEKVRLRAQEVGGQGERIYLLRKVAKSDASAALQSTFNRIGGAAPGVAAARWPSRADEPMVHLFTLDTSTMPELRQRVGAAVRAISVFCWQPDNNEAYESGNDRTAVLFTTDEQLQESPAPPSEVVLQEESFFDAVSVEVSPNLWSRKSELRSSIYSCSARVLGKPIWLQGEEGGAGPFLMQFDENFVPINLGDCGVMYVFGADAFWQCH